MADIQMSFLGAWQVRLAGQIVPHFPTVKVQALLAYLAVEAETAHTRDTLVGLLWGDYRADSARQNLRKALQHLRKFLPPSYLLTTNQTVQFNPSSDYHLDVTQFTQLVDACRRHPHADLLICSACSERLQEAVSLYRGEFLAGFFVSDSPAFEEWVLLKREWLRREVLGALYQLTAYHERQRAYDQAYAYAWRQVELDPVREKAHQQLMQILALSGRRSEALTQYETCRRLLADELAVEPAQETIRLYEQIRNGAFSALPSASISALPLSNQTDEQARLIAAVSLLASPDPVNASTSTQPAQPSPHLARVDWGEAPDVSHFHGRQAELTQLRQWLVDERCRLVAMLGIGGIGKTALATMIATQVAHEFTYVIWRSLRNAPPVEELLGQCIQLVSNHQAHELPAGVDQRIDLLLVHLRQQCCLVVLDNFETVLRSQRAGHYLPGYEGYGQLLQQLGEGRHQSCLVLTSREKPKELAALEGERSPVRTLRLTSVTPEEGRTLLQDRGVFGGNEDWATLHARYSGNPLALKIVSEMIRELFAGNIHDFLQEKTMLFGGIDELLAQQMARLSPLEQELMLWLAVEREPVGTEELRSNMVQSVPKLAVLESLRSLRQRSLIERTATGFTLQNVVLEYLTADLIEQVSREITSGQIMLLQRYALLQAQAKSYVQDSQRTLLLAPLVYQLVEQRGKQGVIEQLTALLSELRHTQPHQAGYAGGNLLNLLVQLNGHLRGLDFSYLAVWQAHLRGVEAQDVNFQQADLSRCVFTDTFSAIYALSFSIDGEQLAAGTIDNEIRIWRTKSGEPLLSFVGHTGWITSICFSPDGKLLASGSADRTIRLWDRHTGQCLRILQGHTNDVRSVCFSPDSKLLASGGEDQTVRLWDAHTGRCLRTLQVIQFDGGHFRGSDAHNSQDLHFRPGYTNRVWAVCFSPDGKLLASGSEDQTVRLWDAHTDQCLRILQGHTNDVMSVCFSPDGKLLASGSEDRTIRLWDADTSQCLRILQGHTSNVRSVCFIPDGRLLASGSEDRTIRLWDTHTGQCLRILQGHTSDVRSVCFIPDGRLLASGSMDQTIRLWEVHTGQPLHIRQGYTDRIWSVCFSPDGKLLASGSMDQTIRLWDAHTGQCLHILQDHTGWITSICFSPDGKLLASGSMDQTIRLWDAHTGQCLRILQDHTGRVWSVCFSPDGKLLTSGSEDQSIRLWDADTSQCLRILQGHTNDVKSVGFSPDGKLLASGSEDQTIRLWDAHTGQCLHILQGHTNDVRLVSFSPDGKLLASGGEDQTVRLWEIYTGQCLVTLPDHTGRAWSVCFSSDSKLLASSSMDQTVRLWDAATGQCLRMLQDHTGWITSICFSPDGKLLASGSMDQTARLWDVATGQCLHILQGHTNDVRSVCFSPNGKLLVSGSEDGTIRVWEVQTGACRQMLHNDLPYARMNIAGATGLTEAQRAALKALGATEYPG